MRRNSQTTDRLATTTAIYLLLLCACASDPAPKTPKTPTPYEQWAGTYVGHLPCADCDSLITSLNLLSDSTGLYTLLRAGREKHPFTDLGVWEVDDSLLVFSGKSGVKYVYRIEQNTLRQLQPDGGKYQGEHAEKYLLTRL